jgi:hypothetical protein
MNRKREEWNIVMVVEMEDILHGEWGVAKEDGEVSVECKEKKAGVPTPNTQQSQSTSIAPIRIGTFTSERDKKG